MYYIKFLIVNLLITFILIKILASQPNLVNGLSISLIFVYFWLSQYLYITWIMYRKPVESMSFRTLSEINQKWTVAHYLNKTPELSRLHYQGKKSELLKGLNRVIEIQSELLKRAEKDNWPHSSTKNWRDEIIKHKNSIEILLNKEKVDKPLPSPHRQLPNEKTLNNPTVASDVKTKEEPAKITGEMLNKETTNSSPRKKRTKTLFLESFEKFLIRSNTSSSAHHLYLAALKNPEAIAESDDYTKSKIQDKIIEYMEQASPEDLEMFTKTIKSYLKKADMEYFLG